MALSTAFTILPALVGAFVAQDTSAGAQEPRVAVEVEIVRSKDGPIGRAPLEIETPETATFDEALWERRLTATDLDRRTQAFERFAARLPQWPEAQAWVMEQALNVDAAPNELSWTCRLLLREFERDANVRRRLAAIGARPITESVDVYLWRVEPSFPSSLESSRDLSVTVVDVAGVWSTSEVAEGERFEALFRGLGHGAVTNERRAAPLAPPVPWARPTPLRFDLTLEGEAAPLGRFEHGGWRVVETMDARGVGLELHSDGTTDITSAATRGVPFPRLRHAVRAPLRLELVAPTLVQSPVPTDRLGVFVDVRDNGLAVLDVERGSVAQRLGIGPGDLLISINGVELRRPDQITTTLAKSARHGRVALRWRKSGEGLEVERVYEVERVHVAEPAHEPAHDADERGTQGTGGD